MSNSDDDRVRARKALLRELALLLSLDGPLLNEVGIPWLHYTATVYGLDGRTVLHCTAASPWSALDALATLLLRRATGHMQPIRRASIAVAGESLHAGAA